MPLSADDRLLIHELVSLHGHLMDGGEFHRMGELFTADVVYDLDDFGLGQLHGLEAIARAAIAMGDRNPLGHHTTNVVVDAVDADTARVRSKGLGVRPDGTSGTVEYDDLVRRAGEGWRIARRTVVARRAPLRR